MVAPSAPPTSTTTQGADTMISTLHPDILQTHVLARLDGPTLAATACTSSELNKLSTDENLWREICTSMWPSINNPRISQVISSFPSGHRSFFSNSYPLLHHQQVCRKSNPPLPPITELISAVDIYYQNIPIFSKVVETETTSDWFLCSPFRVDLLETKEYVETWIYQSGEKDSWVKQLEENITLSWILIDPKTKRAMNVSSQMPVSVQRHWLTGEVQIKFSTIMAGIKGSEKEYTDCMVIVTCGGNEGGGGEVQVRDINLVMEDMQGRGMSGKDSLVILHEAMERGERRKGSGGEEGKERFQEFLKRKRKWREWKQKKEKILDMSCIVVGVTIFVSFWSYILFRLI